MRTVDGVVKGFKFSIVTQFLSLNPVCDTLVWTSPHCCRQPIELTAAFVLALMYRSEMIHMQNSQENPHLLMCSE